MPKFRNQSRISLLRVSLVSSIAALMLSSCSLLPAEEEPLQPPVLAKKEEIHELEAVKRGNMELYLSSTATASSETNKSVAFPESGAILKKLHVQQGDTVKAGQPIAELDTGDLPLRIKLQELTVEQRSLRHSDAVKSGDKNEAKLADIDLEREQLQLDALRKQYQKSLLVSPSDGVITYLNELKPGEAVEANQTMAIISNPDKVNLVYEATDVTKISAVQKGTEVDVTIKKKTYKGTVVQTPSTAPKSEDETIKRRNARSLIIALNEPKPALEIGKLADIKLFIEKRSDVLIIPRSGLYSMFGRNYVKIIENDRVKEVDIEIGLKTSNEVEVKNGVAEGQKVILDS
ncbi:efflux RND transporter periplasmic adaptor subunit [Paenibacillus montanisoli]|uniref:Efflux transporter periplasmic adaptor subunit n=1 Tax=Paenibacillus montanisoli TaxID=2081970 RepID=A0A328U5F6_9BACL|nr:HlyD family efflux transporter periplasmic adaptor subunit [Paenibacillus montanisoli]RAP75136.1 efflux transporter periplasmic adaptor subunit [Paenibacillus montanisoli]